MSTYNGWTNYATWRIALEIFSGYEPEYKLTADDCKEFAEEIIFMDGREGLVTDYALAFISDVNWHEIANNLNEDYED